MDQPGAVRLQATTPEDFAALRELFDDPSFHGWGGAGRLPDEVLEEKYLGGRLPDVECFLVVRGADAVGLAQLHRADDGRGGGMDLILLPEIRGQGVGSAVVELLVERAWVTHGWSRLTVDPDESNTAGIRFWRSAGFTPLRRIADAPEREPYVFMQRHLG